ncbi:MAG: hypothetical protein HFJ36_03885 [Clostridia bacterium]|nr:hypothetical protein [Clostridia bacterium]
MNKIGDAKEKICAFCTGDYHFEMISLPYINKKMANNNEIIILTENDLENTVKSVLEKTNINKEKKKEILKLNWKKDDKTKLEKINNKIEKEMIIFIKGKEKYIKNINENIEKYLPEGKPVKIIDCYDIEEIGENASKVVEKYNKILQTTGEKEIV